MAGRAFRVKIQLDVHAITCPGVWLCPNGKVALRINTLNSHVESHRISPIFPLLFHDRFTFSRIFSQIASLAELQCKLEQELLYAELIQWAKPTSRGIVLATFETNLADLLYPAPCFKGLLAGVDIDLLMRSTKCFPGIIAPKIEVSTKTVIEEVLDTYDTNKCHIVNPKMINSKQTACGQRKKPAKGIIRQRRVCHSKSKSRSQSCRPYRQRLGGADNSHQCFSCVGNHQNTQDDQCYHLIKKDSICASRSCFQKAITCNNIHVMETCPVCFKYNCYFPKLSDDLNIDKKNMDFKRRYADVCHHKACRWIYESSDSPDVQEETLMPLSQSKLRNLQKTRERLCSAETIGGDVIECNPNRDMNCDNTSQGFYKNLEKFYKRMYKQAKIRAQEVES